MGWTFQEYDDTPAKDMYEALELWSKEKLLKGTK